MKLKALLIVLGFFISTPLILGQSRLPSMPDIPQNPLADTSGLPNLPDTPSLPTSPTLPSVPGSIPLDSLRESGLNTDSIANLSSNPEQQARDAASQFSHEGILRHTPTSFPTELPFGQDPTSLGKTFIERTFPKEFNALQGKLNDIPTEVPDTNNLSSSLNTSTLLSNVPSNIPTTTPTIPSLPSL